MFLYHLNEVLRHYSPAETDCAFSWKSVS